MKLIYVITLLVFLAGCKGKMHDRPSSSVKILSPVPNLTEMLFELKLGKYIVGVSDFSEYPDSVRYIEKIGGLTDLSLEKIFRLDPDIIITDSSVALGNRLSKLGEISPEILKLKTETIEDIFQNIEILGEKFDRTKLAESELRKLKDSISAYTYTDSKSRGTVLMVIGRSPQRISGIYVAGKKTFLDELAAICGLRNIISEEGYIQISSEYIYREDIDYIFEFSAGASAEKARDKMREWREFLHRFNKKSKVRLFTESYMVVPGPRVYLALKKLNNALEK